MIPFFISIAVLVVVVLAFLLPVFSRDAEVSEPNRTDINVGIAKAQATELRQRLEAGEISAEVYADEKSRLEAGLARDIEKEEMSVPVNTKGQWLLWPLAAVIPVAAGALYLTLGTPEALDPASHVRQPPEPVASQPPAPDMQVIISRIQQQLEEQPDDARGWFMLGRAHLTLGAYTDAEVALRKSVELDSSNVDVQIRLADAIALTQGGSLSGEPGDILKSALQTQPNHPQGLWLYGMALNEDGEHAEAIAVWNRLLPQLASDPRSTDEVQQLIDLARSQLPAGERSQVSGQVSNAGDQTKADSDKVNGALEVVVEVKPDLATDLPDDTAVFVYAKAVSGPPMPLAVVKRSLGDLPMTVTLSDAQAMIDAMKISAFDEVIVGARISKTGNPVGQPGDFFFETGTVNTRAQSAPIEITISETLP